MTSNIADAKLSLSTALGLLRGLAGEPTADDVGLAREQAHRASLTLAPAKALLAMMQVAGCGGEFNASGAAKSFVESAMMGFPPAIRGLGVCALLNEQTRSMGAGLLRRAAQSGDWIATFLILREAMRGQIHAPVSDLKLLASRLSPDVPFKMEIFAFMEALAGEEDFHEATTFSQNDSLSAAKAYLAKCSQAEGQTLHGTPKIKSFSGVLRPLECDYLMAVSAPLMVPSKVVDTEKAGSVSEQFRTSDGAVLLPASQDFISAGLIRRLSTFAEITPENGEFLSLLRYRPGQEYRPHHDYLPEDRLDYSRVKVCGQRRQTLLTYLNDGYLGGETVFPDLNLSFAGKNGDALLFENTDEAGRPIPASLHAGRPIISGEKWLATLWCREKPFWPWARE